MKQQLAQFLADNFGLAVVTDGAKGLTFATEQPTQMRGALSNVLDAVKAYKHLTEMLSGGLQYRVLKRMSIEDEWQPTQFEFANCNQAIIKAANITQDPLNGEVQVYDAFNNREMFFFPAGGH